MKHSDVNKIPTSTQQALNSYCLRSNVKGVSDGMAYSNQSVWDPLSFGSVANRQVSQGRGISSFTKPSVGELVKVIVDCPGHGAYS